MKIKKAVIISLLSVSIFGVSGQSTFASTSDLTGSDETEIRPYVNWTGTAYLTTSAYSNVTSSNNFFSDRPVVTSNASNIGTISVRVINSKGEQVGSAYAIAPGKSQKLDAIPWKSGTYTLQAIAIETNKSGTYVIGIN